jgi:hypothetical protein
MENFFRFARERHSIYLRRAAGDTRPWTDDPILHEFRFTNVYRELDATTVWFRENVRDSMAHTPEVMLATVLFRWFNRIRTGEAIFGQTTSDSRGAIRTPWEHLLTHEKTDRVIGLHEIDHSVRRYCVGGPYTTGAYIIKTPDGMDKVRGVLWCVSEFMGQEHAGTTGVLQHLSPFNWRWIAETLLADPGNTELESVWSWFRQFPFLGDFMAYELVTDLRHTALLSRAPDIMTWANPGPGAMRGLNRIHDRPVKYSQPKHVFVCEMRALLGEAKKSSLWPANPSGQEVEMRDIEHTLCEFDKYERVRLGEGRPRGKYR